jgi:hypothetical protein
MPRSHILVVFALIQIASMGACSPTSLSAVGSWRLFPEQPALQRDLTSHAWTGRELFIWGGSGIVCPGGGLCGDGALLDPATGTWRSIAASGAPSPRDATFTSWTGTEVFVWGGRTDICASASGDSFFMGCPDGALFDPVANSWRSLPAVPAGLSGREFGTAVWTGKWVIVWGGLRSDASNNLMYLADGARYDPVENSWSPVSNLGAPTPRARHTAVWTGSRMIVWGGENYPGYWGDGAAYDPVADTWAPISSSGAPSARNDHGAIWTGQEMVVLSGANASGYLTDGGRYDPVVDRWTRIDVPDGVSPWKEMIWTGAIAMMWGLTSSNGEGLLWVPTKNGWQKMSPTPIGFRAYRVPDALIWTGAEMVLWGGHSAAEAAIEYGDGAAFELQ